ncbi:MFS transporter [Persicobacter diffluens]|uniref:MFS transporter n=1 Tax=Persicobacter diffluens TaxID=981 RepID=A0AAN4W274_9BACT|nr:MFS transporter [Persicobacter diffluens]
MSAVSIKEKLGYASGDLASNLFWQTFMFFLPIFYSDVFGLPLVQIALLFSVSRIWDAFNDPIMGIIADRTNSRWGKFRPYLLWGAIPFGIIGVLTFSTPDLSPTGKIVYAWITYSLMMMIYTLVNIPYSALMGVLTNDEKARNSISSYRFVFAFGAGLIVTGLNDYLVEFLGQGNDAMGYKLTVLVYAVLAVMLFYFTFFTTKERVKPIVAERSNVLDDLKDLSKNRPWLLLLFAGLFTIFYVSIRNGAIAYYFKYYVEIKSVMWWGMEIKLAPAFMVLGSLAGIVGIFLFKGLTDRLGKRKTYLWLMGLSSFFTMSFYFFSGEQIALIFIGQLLASLFMGPTSPIVWAMYADIADYSEWKTGRRATGLIFSASTFSQKFGWSLAGVVSMSLLAYFGYEANTEQSPESMEGIKLLISIIPAIGSIACVLLVWLYKVDEKTMAKVQQDLRERKTKKGAEVEGVMS